MPRIAALLLCLLPLSAWGQTDPGSQPALGHAWPLLSNIDPAIGERATDGRTVYGDANATGVKSGEWSVFGRAGYPPLTPFLGLGPLYIALRCADCHAYPAPIGASPSTGSHEYAAGTAHGATNTIPSFITSNGPSLIPLVINAQTVGTTTYAAGQKLQVYSIAGRPDVPPSCSPAQPPFASLSGNLTFHQPIPHWGEGLVESVPQTTMKADQCINAGGTYSGGVCTGGRAGGLGITMTRYGAGQLGVKGQSGSLLTFIQSSALYELGITTSDFPGSLYPVANCKTLPYPEDFASQTQWQNSYGFQSWHLTQFQLLYEFMRASAPPTPLCTPVSGSGATCYNSTPLGRAVTAGEVYTGQQQFIAAGCDVCHTPSHIAGPTTMGSNVAGTVFYPYSDYAIHNMGANADGIISGAAGVNDVKTLPLWGLQYKQFFWHDARTTDLAAVPALHNVGEAAGSYAAYNALSTTLKQDILSFLRSQ